MQGVSENIFPHGFVVVFLDCFLCPIDIQGKTSRFKKTMKRRRKRGEPRAVLRLRIPFLHVWVLKKRATERKLSTSAFLESLVRQYFRANDPRSAGPLEDMTSGLAPTMPRHKKDMRRVEVRIWISPDLLADVALVVRAASISADRGRLFSRFFRVVIEDALLKGRISPTGMIRLPEGYEVKT
jgi:hypothetical protein